MEKISIQSSISKVSLYAKLTVGNAPAAKAKDGAAVPVPATADDGAKPDGSRTFARSQDGDTFSLSIEARAIQVTRSITIETAGDDGRCGRPAESDRLSAGGRVEALMDMLDALAEERTQGHSRKPHRNAHFPKLADADDLAATMLDHWRREHAEAGGPRRDFADALRGRLDKWRSAGTESVSRMTMEVTEFRAEVSIKVSAGLRDWEAGEQESPATTA